MGKTTIGTISYFYPLPPLNNVEKQRTKLVSSYVMSSQHCIRGRGRFLNIIFKISIIFFSLIVDLFAKFSGDVQFLCFQPKIFFLGKFGPENQNCQFKLKFGTKANSKMHYLTAAFTFTVVDRKYHFQANLIVNLS